MKRLEKELDKLRTVSKTMYKEGKKDLARIMAVEKEGGSPRKVKALLDELPASYLPDENDRMIEALNSGSEFEPEKPTEAVSFGRPLPSA